MTQPRLPLHEDVVLLRRREGGFDVVADRISVKAGIGAIIVPRLKPLKLPKPGYLFDGCPGGERCDCNPFTQEIFERSTFKRRGLRVYVSDGRKPGGVGHVEHAKSGGPGRAS